MSETQCWLVEREYGTKGLVTLVYATPDGERQQTRQRSSAMLRNSAVTAAVAVPEDDLEPVRDESDRERYAREAERMLSQCDPDDEV
jgi:hypothetical protein